MYNILSRERILIIGSDISAFHFYLKYQINHPDNEIVGFVICNQSEDKPIPLFFKGYSRIPLKIYKEKKLEKVIRKKSIKKCFICLQNISLENTNSIIFRIIAIGSCSIEFVKPQVLKTKSFKPVILISSISPHIGKTQLARYFCSVLNANQRKVAVIIPINYEILQIENKEISSENSNSNSDNNDENSHESSEIVEDDNVLSENKLITQYVFKSNDTIPCDTFNKKIEWEIEQFQKSGAFRIYVTNNPRISIIHAEQNGDIIIYDSCMCESPLIDFTTNFCIITKESIFNIGKKACWGGLVNLKSCENVVVLSKVPNDDDENIKYFPKKKKRVFFGHTQYIPEDASPLEVFNHKVLFVDEKKYAGVSQKMALENGASEFVDPSPFLVDGLEIENCSLIADIGSDSSQPPNEDEEKENITMNKIAKAINKADADIVIVSLQRDLDGIEPGKKIIYTTPEIQDHKDAMYNWLSRYFIQNVPPPLKNHFEAQVDILMAMAGASDKELYVTNNESANREAFCRLFLSSHLPPGFRVTNGEIIDCMSNITGQLDVVIVNDSCPYMTLDHSGFVIAPILADNVLSVIEVKTSLTSETLRKALSQLRPVKALMPTHGTLVRPDGQIIEDPLGGKIITGIFAFTPLCDIKKIAPSLLKLYPNVVDFIVTPEDFGIFSVETLKVCGITVRDEEIVNGYVQFTARGIGLALIFGVLNSLAATRRFSSSYCVRYLNGNWGSQMDAASRYKEEMVKSLNKMNKIFSVSCSHDQKSSLYKKTAELLNAVEIIRSQV